MSASTQLGLALVLAALAAPATAGELPAGDPDHGKAVYEGTCVACHGPEGHGSVPGAPDFADADAIFAQKRQTLLTNMAEGLRRPGSPMGMPPRGGDDSLTDQDLLDALAYIRQALR